MLRPETWFKQDVGMPKRSWWHLGLEFDFRMRDFETWRSYGCVRRSTVRWPDNHHQSNVVQSRYVAFDGRTHADPVSCNTHITPMPFLISVEPARPASQSWYVAFDGRTHADLLPCSTHVTPLVTSAMTIRYFSQSSRPDKAVTASEHRCLISLFSKYFC
jgi:hypothetical protein